MNWLISLNQFNISPHFFISQYMLKSLWVQTLNTSVQSWLECLFKLKIIFAIFLIPGKPSWPSIEKHWQDQETTINECRESTLLSLPIIKTRQPFSWLFSKFLDMSVVFSQSYEGRKNRAFGSKCCKRKSHTGAAKWKVTCLLAFVCMHGNVVVNLVLHFNKIIIIWQLHKKVIKTRYYI